MSNPSKIKSKEYRNWVRGALGLFYLQKGLYSFTDRVVKAEHARIVQHLSPCTRCAIENILPDHASSKCCIQKNKARCNCRKKTNTNCATCSKIYDEIVLQHRFREPNWVTDCSKWYNDYWQFAKCFLTTTSRGSNNTAAETDASGLLSIIINGLFIQSDIQCNIDPPNDSFSLVREIRNEILHNSTLDLTDQDVARYLQSMIAVLEDKKTLCLDPAAQAAAIKLKEILNDELIITTNEEASAIQAALDAIKEVKEQSEDSIRKLAEEKQNAIKASEENIRRLAEEKQNAFKTSEDSIRKLAEEKQIAIKESEDSIRKLAEEKQIAIKESEDSIRKLAEEKQIAIKESEDSIRKLAEEKQIAIKESEDSIRKLAEEKQIAIKEAEDSIRKLAEVKENDMRASEENIRKLAEEKEKAIKASEKNIKGIAEDSLNALQRQTLQSATKIKTVKDDAIENVISTVSVVIKETYEPEMKILYSRQDDHENRLKAMELEQQSLQLKQLNLEKQVAKLKTTEEKHQTRLEYIKQKQGLQQYLVDVYQQHYVKTSISPLMTQHNDVNIKEVYVSPRMVMEENKDGKDGHTTKYGKDGKTNYKQIERYRDFLRTREKRNRNIFMIGDVGTGKTSFCKMMMQDWCSTIKNRVTGDESGVSEEEDSRQGEEGYPRDLNLFDFLFYIPLREMSGQINDCVDMVKAQLGDYKVLLDEIFTNDSERILILADGLDEWTPPRLNRPLSLHHVTFGIPTSHSARDSTIIITSRPSSRGILNMKSSEYDLKVTLLGLNYNSVKPMIEKYMKFLNKTSAVSDFETKLSLIELKDIQNAPLLLQQIIWLYCNNYDIDRSRSLIYINIVNIILAWEDERNVAELTPHDFQTSDLKRLPLPKSFETFVRCQENRQLLLFLGKIAYYAYIKDSDSSLVFGRNKLKQLGASNDNISAILRTGILTEINSSDPTYEKSRLSFIHTSYLEFFAALYICSCYLSKIPDAHSLDARLNILKNLIALTPTTSSVDVLRLGNVFIMMCGLVPCLLDHIFECIDKVSFDDTFSVKIGELYLDCLSEFNSINQENIINFKRSKLYVPWYLNEKRLKVFLRCVDPVSIKRCSTDNEFVRESHEQCSLLSSFLSQAVSLRTLKIYDKTCFYDDRCVGHIIDLTNHKTIHSLNLSRTSISVSGVSHTCLKSCIISECELTHEQYSMLSSYLSQAVSLRTLKKEGVECVKDKCEGHYIDLTNHKKLQSLTLSKSKIVSGINHTSLTSCVLSECELGHEQCSLLLSCLSKAVSLRTLKIENIECAKDVCEGHIIDFTNHNKLQSLELSGSKISVSGVNNTCLKSCVISFSNLSHEHLSLLLSSLSQSVSLQTLELDGIDCSKNKCEGHIINLSNHKKLQSLNLSDSKISVYSINHTRLESCVILCGELSHEQNSLLSSCLSQAVSLRDLKIKMTKCTEGECEGHIIDLTKHNKIQSLKLSGSNISVSGINHIDLESCVISYCMLRHEQCSMLSSFLSQAVSLRDLEIEMTKCTEHECEGHIIDLTKHNKIQSLKLSGSNISVSCINHIDLESCVISYCELRHEQCSMLSSFLSQNVSLRDLKINMTKCTEDECEGHILYLANHIKMKRLALSGISISVCGLNHTCLESCFILDCELSHEHCSLLSSCLSQAVSLRTLEIGKTKCSEDEYESHIIDLTNLKQLQSLTLSRTSISVSGVNHTCLESCFISGCELSHEQCSLLSSCLSQAVSLKTLRIEDIECTDKTCLGHLFDFTNHNNLQLLELSGLTNLFSRRRTYLLMSVICSKISVSGINNTCLGYCVISDCELSHKQCTLLTSCLSQVVSLKHLEIKKIKCTQDECEGHIIDFTNHEQLQSLKLSRTRISVSGIIHTFRLSCVISSCELSHEQCSLLSSCLSQAASLRSVEIDNIECTKDECEGHIIDLTKQKRLHRLELSGSKIEVSGLNYSCLEYCVISNCEWSHEQCSLFSSFLAQAVSLRTVNINNIECTQDECEGHIIDLTKHKKLHRLELSGSKIIVSGINHTCLESCVMSGCVLSHEQCSLLSSCLSQALSIHKLKIDGIECVKDECEGHIIDLTNHEQLQSLKLSRTWISVSGINHTSLNSCVISDCELSHEQCSMLSSYLSQAVSLLSIEIDSIECTKDQCEGHITDWSNHKDLVKLVISRSKISVSDINNTCLKACVISDCVLSHEQYSLLSSCLSQAVLLRTLIIDDIECAKDKCDGHIFYLTNHKILENVTLSGSKISVSGINHTCLESCSIAYCELSHDQCSLLLSTLSLAGSLKTLEIIDIECTKDECEGHIIDLTNHKKLQSLSLSGRKISVSGISHICLESCGISDCELSHEQCSLLSSCMSQALSLHTLKIYNIVCTKDECEGHIIDLTNHKKLQSLELSGSKISVSGVNHTFLE